MKMVECRNCGQQIAKKAKICPYCGCKNKKPIYKRVWFIILVVIMLVALGSCVNTKIKERFDWNDIQLSYKLPKPKSKVGIIYSDEYNYLSMEVKKTSSKEYRNYINDCIEFGFTLESETKNNDYVAFDAEGYKLTLHYYDKEMDITLKAPIELGYISWPYNDLVLLLPIPNVKEGKIETDTSTRFKAYIGKTSIDDYNNYVDSCIFYGFNVDYSKSDKSFRAKDSKGNSLYLDYLGNKVMSIEIIKAKEDTSNNNSPSQNEDNNQEDNLVDGMHHEFKEAMDSYEAFMNEYIDFMIKYENSDGSDPKLLLDYVSYVAKYAEFVDNFDKWEDEDLNAKELAYYIEVQTRINKRLLEID